MLKELKLVGELFYLLSMKFYLKSILLCLAIARDLLGGIIAIGYTRSVLLFLVSMTMLVWYLTFLTK